MHGEHSPRAPCTDRDISIVPKERTVRIRTADEKAFLTIKGITVGAIRSEYEYEIPFDEGNAMLEELAEKPLIEKRRYKIPVAGVAHGLHYSYSRACTPFFKMLVCPLVEGLDNRVI